MWYPLLAQSPDKRLCGEDVFITGASLRPESGSQVTASQEMASIPPPQGSAAFAPGWSADVAGISDRRDPEWRIRDLGHTLQMYRSHEAISKWYQNL